MDPNGPYWVGTHINSDTGRNIEMTKSTKAKTGKTKAADRRSFIKGAALAGAGATVVAA